MEIVPVVNEEGNTIGSATREECHDGSRLLHPVIHLHVFNPDGDLYLQRRAFHKDTHPGKWDTAVGGHIAVGEDIVKALFREAVEELGITGFTLHYIARYTYDSPEERELVYVYRTVYDELPVPNPDELAGGAFHTLADLHRQLTDPDLAPLFTPNFRHDFFYYLLPHS